MQEPQQGGMALVGLGSLGASVLPSPPGTGPGTPEAAGTGLALGRQYEYPFDPARIFRASMVVDPDWRGTSFHQVVAGLAQGTLTLAIILERRAQLPHALDRYDQARAFYAAMMAHLSGRP